jgi:hypothetical protein
VRLHDSWSGSGPYGERECAYDSDGSKGPMRPVSRAVASVLNDRPAGSIAGADGERRVGRVPVLNARQCTMSSKPIEAISVGDRVLAWDERGGATITRQVARLFRRPALPIVEVIAMSSSGARQLIECTTEHPFWVHGRGWTEACRLRQDDELHGLNGDRLRLLSVTDRGREAPVFNFEVEDAHNYFVGVDGILVHNESHKPYSKGRLDKAMDWFRAHELAVTLFFVRPANLFNHYARQFDHDIPAQEGQGSEAINLNDARAAQSAIENDLEDNPYRPVAEAGRPGTAAPALKGRLDRLANWFRRYERVLTFVVRLPNQFNHYAHLANHDIPAQEGQGSQTIKLDDARSGQSKIDNDLQDNPYRPAAAGGGAPPRPKFPQRLPRPVDMRSANVRSQVSRDGESIVVDAGESDYRTFGRVAGFPGRQLFLNGSKVEGSRVEPVGHQSMHGYYDPFSRSGPMDYPGPALTLHDGVVIGSSVIGGGNGCFELRGSRARGCQTGEGARN